MAIESPEVFMTDYTILLEGAFFLKREKAFRTKFTKPYNPESTLCCLLPGDTTKILAKTLLDVEDPYFGKERLYRLLVGCNSNCLCPNVCDQARKNSLIESRFSSDIK